MSETIGDRLLAFAPEPPEGAWDRIAAALDGTAPVTLSEKLLQYEAAPPEGTWEKIESRLSGLPEETKMIPVKRLGSRKLRYIAVAAAFLLVASTAALYLVQQAGTAKHAASAHAGLSRPASSNASLQLSADSLTRNNHPVAEYAATETADPQRIAPQRSSLLGRLRPRNVSAASMLGGFIPRRAEPKRTVAYSQPEKYMVYTDGDGHAMKLPKKLFDFFSCASEEEICKQKMQELQERLASTSVTADFTGVLEILHNLKENQ